MKISNSIMLIFIVQFTFGFCNFSIKANGEKKILDYMQGKWILHQNKKQKIMVKADTIYYYNERVLESKFLLRITKSVVSNIFEKDTITAKDGDYFLEELNVSTHEVQFQYLIISYEKRKFVLSPLHSNELLTYNKR